jgi:PilZ domain-containing protein
LKSTDRFLVEGVACTVHGRNLPVVNLSVGGLFAATTTNPPPPGELLEVEVTLKALPPFRVMGKVVWINEGERPRAPDLPQGFGFKITRIALPDKIAILDFLKRASPSRPAGHPPAR